MRTAEFVRSELKRRIPLGDPVPPLTAVETLICEAIDRLKHVPVKNPLIKPHEQEVFEEITKL